MMRKSFTSCKWQGIKYTYTKPADATEENPYKVVKAYKADGTEIDRNKTYKAIINDFLYGGGDGFSSLLRYKIDRCY